MTSEDLPVPLGVSSIFHPSDFSEASEVAFGHALKLALMAKSRLTVMHVFQTSEENWDQFPGVRDLLIRWKLIPEGSPRSAVTDLGIQVSKVAGEGRNPIPACLAYLADRPCDLIVLAVRQNEGRMRWFARSVGEPIAQGSGEMTLFLPHGVPGFVSMDDGSIHLESILIPIAVKPSSQTSINAINRFLQHLNIKGGTVRLLHVGSPENVPPLDLPSESGWKWVREDATGNPAQVILERAKEISADLIVMTTDGPEGFLDGLRGTTSERVLRQASCPILNIPVGSLFG